MLRTYAGAGLPSYLIAAHVLSMVSALRTRQSLGVRAVDFENHA